MLVHTKEQYSSTESNWANGGSYLPLAVWKQQGYDVDRIASVTKPCDIQENEQLGTCYRVKIFSKSESGSQGSRETLSLQCQSGNAPAFKRSLGGDRPAVESKKDFNMRLEAEKAQRKLLDKKEASAKACSTQLVKVLAKSKQPLEQFLNAPDADLPQSLLNKAQALLRQLQQSHSKLESIAEHPEEALDLDREAEKQACHS